jgi:leucyl aminopeptidase (aminopeptidase T)
MNWPQKRKIRQGVLDLLRVNMGLQSGEKLLVVTDLPTAAQWKEKGEAQLKEALARAMLARLVAEIAAGEYAGCEVEFYPFPSVSLQGQEPGQETAAKLAAADVVVAITTYSLSHTAARERAAQAGVRVASMPGFLADMLYPGGPMAVDYQQVAADSQAVAELLSAADEAVVRSAAGSELRLSLAGRAGRPDDGIYTRRGTGGNLPAGEAYIAPLEGTAEGQLVAPAGWHPGLKEDMVLVLQQGELREIRGGGSVGGHLLGHLRPDLDKEPYRSRRNLAELGVGTNPNARRPDNVLEAEKIKGTVHLALGNNSYMGGMVNADFHLDFVLPEPDLILDGRAVITRGKWNI